MDDVDDVCNWPFSVCDESGPLDDGPGDFEPTEGFGRGPLRSVTVVRPAVDRSDSRSADSPFTSWSATSVVPGWLNFTRGESVT